MPMLGDSVYHPSDRFDVSAYQVVLTRYNLRSGPVRRATRAQERKRRRWLDTRFKLFTTFCLPSMINQTRRPDIWLIAFDGESREAVQPVLDAIKDHPWIVPAWQRPVDGIFEDLGAVSSREILARLPPGKTQLITTRLDNDDAVNKHFLEHVRCYAASVLHYEPDLSDFWVVFPIGADYFKARCRFYVSSNNAFCTRVQPVATLSENLETVHAFQHARLFLSGCKVFLPMTTDPMWIRNFHGGNLSLVSMADRRNFTASATRTVLRQCGIRIEQEPKPVWPNLFERTPEGRRSRRRLAKRVLQSVGLLKSRSDVGL